MKARHVALLASIALFAALAFLATRALGLGDVVRAGGDPLNFEADLAGANEVPAVTTDVVGKAEIEFNEDLTEATIELEVENAVLGVTNRKATQSHIHCAPAGSNGPVVVFLAGFHNQGWNVDGSWIENASFVADNIVNTTCGSTMAALRDSIAAGNTYVNVHSILNPGGEVRGQLEED